MNRKKIFDQLDHLGAWDLLSRFENYLSFFEIKNLDDQTHNLSGGEQKKILLSLGLTSKASLILWDEPTNHLDIESIQLFEDELRQTDKSFIIILP